MTLPADLGPKLSDAASVVVPGDPTFAGLSSRWREWHGPKVAAVVNAATEGDIQHAVGLFQSRSQAMTIMVTEFNFFLGSLCK